MRKTLLCLTFVAAAATAAHAASVSRTYSYFSIGGSTLGEIETELQRRGPQLQGTGNRHPGATRMEFSTRVTYGESGGRCSVTAADVTVKANMILPRWRRPGSADQSTRLIWDTLAADIKRHEEAHVVIARNHARELEQELVTIRNETGCEAAAARVEQVSQRVLDKHDREQARFDRIEMINFEDRMMRLLDYRMERMERARNSAPPG